MSSPSDSHLGPCLRRELDEHALDEQFAAIERGLTRRAHRRQLGWTVAAAAAVVLMILAMQLRTWMPEDGRPALVTVPQDEQRMVLADGSVLTLASATEVRMCSAGGHDVCVELVHGSVEFAVTHDPSREFVVEAGEARVRVIGTRFTVERDADARVAVVVHEGIVSVDLADGSSRRLSVGERWELRGDAHHSMAAAEVREPAQPVVGSEAPSEAAPDPTTEPAQAEPPEVDHGQDPARPSSARGGASEATDLDTEQGPSAADQLWSDARRARREGLASEEAAAYVEFLDDHPNDPRNALAVFELGRLRMDELDDTRGAIEALERAVDLGGSAGLNHEDALARLARLYARAGSLDECKTARERYLEAYPAGVHLTTVERLCPE